MRNIGETDLSCGVVICAKGNRYIDMAQTAAAGIRRFDPLLPCDVFSDVQYSIEGFDRTIKLLRQELPPKIEAMLGSRFERTLFLDADVFVVNPISSIFDTLERFDIALAHDFERNSPHGRRMWNREVPTSFPQFNSGVIGFRRSQAVSSLLESWGRGLEEAPGRDQPLLRELLWESDLRIATLPPEFNFCELNTLPFFRRSNPAPRVVHYFDRKPKCNQKVNPTEILGRATLDLIEEMSRSDKTLPNNTYGAKRRGLLRKRVLQARALVEALSARRRK